MSEILARSRSTPALDSTELDHHATDRVDVKQLVGHIGVNSNMKQQAPNCQSDRPSERMVIVSPSPHEGVTRALRSAYRGGTEHLPPEMVELINKLN